MYICYNHSMQHIKTLSLNNIIVWKKRVFHQRITFCLHVYVSPSGFYMEISSASPAQTMGHCKGCSYSKIILCSHQSTGLVLPTSTSKAKVSASLQTFHSQQSTYSSQLDARALLLKSSFGFFITSTVHKDQSLLKNSPKWPCSYI